MWLDFLRTDTGINGLTDTGDAALHPYGILKAFRVFEGLYVRFFPQSIDTTIEYHMIKWQAPPPG